MHFFHFCFSVLYLDFVKIGEDVHNIIFVITVSSDNLLCCACLTSKALSTFPILPSLLQRITLSWDVALPIPTNRFDNAVKQQLILLWYGDNSGTHLKKLYSHGCGASMAYRVELTKSAEAQLEEL